MPFFARLLSPPRFGGGGGDSDGGAGGACCVPRFARPITFAFARVERRRFARRPAAAPRSIFWEVRLLSKEFANVISDALACASFSLSIAFSDSAASIAFFALSGECVQPFVTMSSSTVHGACNAGTSHAHGESGFIAGARLGSARWSASLGKSAADTSSSVCNMMVVRARRAPGPPSQFRFRPPATRRSACFLRAQLQS